MYDAIGEERKGGLRFRGAEKDVGSTTEAGVATIADCRHSNLMLQHGDDLAISPCISRQWPKVTSCD